MPMFQKTWGELSVAELTEEEENKYVEGIDDWDEQKKSIIKQPDQWLTSQHPLLQPNPKRFLPIDVGNFINDFARFCSTLIGEEIGKEMMDLAGPSLLFRYQKFQENLEKKMEEVHVGHKLNPVACVHNKILYDVEQIVGMMSLFGMLMPLLKQYSNQCKIQLLAMYLFGLTHDGNWNNNSKLSFQTSEGYEKVTKASICDRVKALLEQRVQCEAKTVRLAMMTGITLQDASAGHWILIVFDFDIEDLNLWEQNDKKGLPLTTAFYFPEWEFDCSSLVTSIADACNFQLKDEPIRILAASAKSFPRLHNTAVELTCGCTALRHMIMCSVCSTSDLADPRCIQMFRILDRRIGLISFPIFSNMWKKLMQKKQELELQNMKPTLELPDILERLPKKPRKDETFNFLLLCSPVKDPGVDISNCEDPPFLALSVDFPPKGGDPVIVSAKP